MSKLDLKDRARSFRKQGFSLSEISRKINVSKSTSSLWCSDILLTKPQIVSLEKRAKMKNYKGALKGALANHIKSQAVINNEKFKAKEFLGKISDREVCLIGTALYWAEGHKTGRTLGIVNSDYKIILISMKWLSIEFNVVNTDYMPRLFINQDHKYRESEIKKYWSDITKIPLLQFRHTIFIKSKHKKLFSNPELYVGVMHLRIKKSSQILYRTLGQIDVFKNIAS